MAYDIIPVFRKLTEDKEGTLGKLSTTVEQFQKHCNRCCKVSMIECLWLFQNRKAAKKTFETVSTEDGDGIPL